MPVAPTLSAEGFFEIPDKAILLDYGTPTLSAFDQNQVLALNPHLYLKWSWFEEKWGVWFNDHINSNHLVMFATHMQMQNGYAKQQMQKNLYYRQKSYKRMVAKMLQREQVYKAHQQAHQDDEVDQFAKQDLDPVLRSLKSAGTSSHGDSKFKFAGLGEGTAGKDAL